MSAQILTASFGRVVASSSLLRILLSTRCHAQQVLQVQMDKMSGIMSGTLPFSSSTSMVVPGRPAASEAAVWVARKLLRRGSSRGVNSGFCRYHKINLYCAGFGPFLAAAVAQAAEAAAGKWARYSRSSKPALTPKVCPPATHSWFPFCRRRRRCACV